MKRVTAINLVSSVIAKVDSGKIRAQLCTEFIKAFKLDQAMDGENMQDWEVQMHDEFIAECGLINCDACDAPTHLTRKLLCSGCIERLLGQT